MGVKFTIEEIMAIFRVKVKGVKKPRYISAPSEEYIRNIFQYIKIEWIKKRWYYQ